MFVLILIGVIVYIDANTGVRAMDTETERINGMIQKKCFTDE